MLAILKRIVQELNQVLVFDEALSLLALRVREAIKVDCCSIYLANYEQQCFLLKATEGLDKQAIDKVAIGFNEGLIGLVGQREEPINISDAHSHPRFKFYPEVKEENYHAFLGTPIIHQRKVLGVITLQQRDQRLFNEDEEAFLVTLAAQIALEIVHSQARGSLDHTPSATRSSFQTYLRGVPGAEGIGIGEAVSANRQATLAAVTPMRCTDIEAQRAMYRQAVKETRVQVRHMAERMLDSLPEDVHAIFDLYHHLLDASSLGYEVEAHIDNGWTAASGLKLVVEQYAKQFESMEDTYMRERAVDVVDVGDKILANMLNSQTDDRSLPEQIILVAEEISASMLAEYPRENLCGIISMRGSQNSHAAIMARAMGLPAVMGLTDVPVNMLAGKSLVVDGYSGEVIVAPGESILTEYRALAKEERELSAHLQTLADKPCVTGEGELVSLQINAGLAAEFEQQQSGVDDGVGLYRTEVPFMMGERFPSENEQVNMYRNMLAVHPDKMITMRTLDVGGDKPLPYLPIHEENPFLGWRGIRLTLDHPEIFLVQVRAMLKASDGQSNLRIMLPMISTLAEVEEAKRLIRQAWYEVNEDRGEHPVCMPAVGVMLEVPAVLYQLPQLAQKVDFFSVGSNDLTQYLLAVDRNNARVSSLYDAYHPAVLMALKQVIEQAAALQVPTSVCGELAGEPCGAFLLLAMGYRQLSMNSHSLLKIKWVTRNIDMPRAREVLESVLLMENGREVRDLVNKELEIMGLGGLVRAGK